MAEVYGDDHGPTRWNLGLRYAAAEERLFLNASYGQPLNRGSQSLLTVGGKLAF